MRSPELSELPPPPAGRVGFPWTEGSPRIADLAPTGRPWPAIGIVTPSYQQGRFLEETVRSVLLQGYPELDYRIIDGGSTDESAEIIKKYSPWLSGWVSEKDAGQTDAINKGLARANGQVLAYLNSDDTYARGALAAVASQFSARSDLEWLIGVTQVVDERGNARRLFEPKVEDRLSRWVTHGVAIPQPSTFFSRAAHEKAGPFDVTFSRSMDQEYWARLAVLGFRPQLVPEVLANFRLHGFSKTCHTPPVKFFEEDIRICEMYFDRLDEEGRRFATSYIRDTRAYIACWDVYQELPHGRRRAQEALLRLLARKPELLARRITWGLIRRFVTPGGLRQLARDFNLEGPA